MREQVGMIVNLEGLAVPAPAVALVAFPGAPSAAPAALAKRQSLSFGKGCGGPEAGGVSEPPKVDRNGRCGWERRDMPRRGEP